MRRTPLSGSWGSWSYAEGVVAGGVVAGAAGRGAWGVFFSRRIWGRDRGGTRAGVAGVDEFLRDVEGVEGVGVGGVAELPEDGGDLLVSGVGVVTGRVMESCRFGWKSLKGGGGGGGAGWGIRR